MGVIWDCYRQALVTLLVCPLLLLPLLRHNLHHACVLALIPSSGQRDGVSPLLTPPFSSFSEGDGQRAPLLVVGCFLITFSSEECQSDIFRGGIS